MTFYGRESFVASLSYWWQTRSRLDQKFDRAGANTSFFAGNTAACRTTFKEIRGCLVIVSQKYLVSIFHNMPHIALFSRKCILSEGRQLRGVAISGGASPEGLRRRLFFWETNSRIRPTSMISSEASGGTGASKVRSDESRAQESRGRFEREGLLWEGCELHGKAAGTASLYFKLKGNSKYRPLAQSDELSITSFPRPRSIFVLNRVLRSSFAVVSLALSSLRDLFLSRDTVSSLFF